MTMDLFSYTLDKTLCDKSSERIVSGRWFSPVSSTNKIDHHDVTDILLKVAFNTIARTLTQIGFD
jgi:hypothetical protein